MNRPKRMLVENVGWAAETAASDPDFFETLAQGQSPTVLWLGCSDSRVPAETITHSKPGDLFVHRNIANLFSPDDDNTMSVLEYAVNVLKVDDVIVCGHYGCGGVRAVVAAVVRRPAPRQPPHCPAVRAGAAHGERTRRHRHDGFAHRPAGGTERARTSARVARDVRSCATPSAHRAFTAGYSACAMAASRCFHPATRPMPTPGAEPAPMRKSAARIRTYTQRGPARDRNGRH